MTILEEKSLKTMKTLSFISIIVVSFCCGKQNKTTQYVSEKLTNQIVQTSGGYDIYIYEDTSFKQIIRIKKLSDIEIEFDVNTVDKNTGDSSVINGTAIRKTNEDPQVDIDEKEEGYYSTQYTYSKGECLLLIRIEEDTGDLLKLFSFRCYDFPGRDHGMFSLKILLRRKLK